VSEQNKTEINEEQIPTVEDSSVEELTSEQVEEQVEQDVSAMLSEAQAEAEKQKELALRTLADMENLRRRTRIDLESAHKFALEKFVDALVPVMDSMEMGIDAASKEEVTKESIQEGMDMTLKQFIDVLGNFNVERIDPVGEKFDPQLHEAMTMVPSSEHESQTVMEVFQKGYRLNERLVRPARVIVAQ